MTFLRLFMATTNRTEPERSSRVCCWKTILSRVERDSSIFGVLLPTRKTKVQIQSTSISRIAARCIRSTLLFLDKSDSLSLLKSQFFGKNTLYGNLFKPRVVLFLSTPASIISVRHRLSTRREILPSAQPVGSYPRVSRRDTLSLGVYLQVDGGPTDVVPHISSRLSRHI